MTAAARNLIRRTTQAVRAAVQMSRTARYQLINGRQTNDQLATGALIRTGDMLERLGITLKDGQASWYGRHVAKAYRAQHGTDAPKAWVQHRTTGRWIRVFVYSPTDPALLAGLHSYKATAGLVTRASFAEAA
jgi:hypothetical protein